jgi:uncharacterized protein
MAENSADSDRQRVLQLDEEMRDMPREVRNILNPVRLTGKDSLKFSCHPGISCFNACCRNIEILLTPYDILRLRRRLKISSELFLYNYATPTTLSKGQLPVPIMRMDEETGRCPFNTDEGCSVYEDRPVTCRYYPVGMALMHKQDAKDEEEFYFLIKEDFCKGHEEDKEWTVFEWRKDQGSDGYDEQNRGWMELILKRRSAGDAVKTSVQLSEFFYMASTDPEAFRRFIFSSTFLERYAVDDETQANLREDDQFLTEFSFAWLRTVLFGEKNIKVRPEAVEEMKKRKPKKQTEADLDDGQDSTKSE